MGRFLLNRGAAALERIGFADMQRNLLKDRLHMSRTQCWVLLQTLDDLNRFLQLCVPAFPQRLS